MFIKDIHILRGKIPTNFKTFVLVKNIFNTSLCYH